mmetsp:Transcript_37226/g.105073  ORF Transcript_37226/g.105073 Transcript_37226/m.105073 type:complete len:802 (+) Transcript_37226:105-2510(+)
MSGEQEQVRVPVHQGTLVLRKHGKDTSRYFILYEDTLEYFKSHAESQSADVQPRGCLLHGDFHTIEVANDGVIFSHQDDWGVHLIAAEEGDMRPWCDAFAQILRATHTEGERGTWTRRAEAEGAEREPPKPAVLCEGWAQVEKKHGALAKRYFELTDECLNYYESDKDLDESRPPRGVIQFHDVESFRAAGWKFYFYIEELKKPVVLQVDNDSDFEMWVGAFQKVIGHTLGDKFVLEREEAAGDAPMCQGAFKLEVDGKTETKLVRLFEDRLEYAAWSEQADREAVVEKSIPTGSIKDIEIADDGLVLEVEGLGSMALRAAQQAPGGKAADLDEWVAAFSRVCKSESPSPARKSPERRQPPGQPAPDQGQVSLNPMELLIEMPRRSQVFLDSAVEALYQGSVSMSENGAARANYSMTMCRDRFLYFTKLSDASNGAQLKQVLASDVRKIVVLDDGFQIVLDAKTLELHDIKRDQMEEWALSFRGIASWRAQQPQSSSSEDRYTTDAEQCSVQVTTSGTAPAQLWASKMTPNHIHKHRVSFDDSGGNEDRARSHSPKYRFFVPRCGRIPPPERYRSPEPKKPSFFSSRGRQKLDGLHASLDPFVINTCRSSPQSTKLLHGSEQCFLTTGRQINDDHPLLVKLNGRDPEVQLPPSKHAINCLATKITGESPRIFELSPTGDRGRSCTSRAGSFTWTKITSSEDNGSPARCTPRQHVGGLPITAKVNEANRSLLARKDGLVGKITDPGRAGGSFRRASSQPIPGKITDAAREAQGWVRQGPHADSVRKYKDMGAKTYTRNKLWH